MGRSSCWYETGRRLAAANHIGTLVVSGTAADRFFGPLHRACWGVGDTRVASSAGTRLAEDSDLGAI